MENLDVVLLTLFIAITFCMLGLASWLSGHVYIGLWVASFVAFLASFTIFLVRDVFIEYEIKEQAE